MAKFDKAFRKEVNEVHPYIQGETEAEVKRRYGLKAVIKLGSNENPYGPYYHAKQAMIRSVTTSNRYPEDDFIQMKAVIAQHVGLQPENVALGSGAGNLIENIAKMVLNTGDEVLIAKQSYRLYREASKLMGAKVIEIPLTNHFQFDLDQFAAKVTKQTKLIWLCNPNNPTATVVNAQELRQFIDQLPDHVWVVVDEAYAEFADEGAIPDLTKLIGNKRLVVLRTFSKFYGLAGARLAYLLAAPKVIQAYDTVTEPFNTSRIALAGAIASLQFDQAQAQSTLAKIQGDREGLIESLEILGCSVAPSQANFIFAKLPDDVPSATEICEELMKRGVIVRDCTPWGYPNHIRITIGKHAELERFLNVFAETLARE
ncbi:histidinol-phosphate aminotransferase [Lentilactobacillus fungorum]|uniref:Histidinol-phosphate aminotransferase n=1 Tax=Lentilactobacillus fungorum TaxID=2201250 RepID=A0ABQ3W098_9LACO|nr:histidinol-phosphate transaminase [Lentilactobacillus fungorum]GHP14587.1 histidinol-phosphate aminotransferase [Lentilactobacillus fungorum]